MPERKLIQVAAGADLVSAISSAYGVPEQEAVKLANRVAREISKGIRRGQHPALVTIHPNGRIDIDVIELERK